jgi:hypothetical protein
MATETRQGVALQTETLSGLHWAGILLAVVSGVVHLVLGVSFAPSPLGISFLLAGVAFLVAVTLVLLDVRRRQLYAVGVPFTAIQVVLWYYLNYLAGDKTLAQIGTVEIVDKVAQVALIAVLVVLYRRAS